MNAPCKNPSLIAAMSLALLASCGSERPPAPPPPPTVDAGPYVLQPGDFVALKYYNNPDLNDEVIVRPDGFITVPLIGDVPAAGRQPADVAQDLNHRFTGELAKPRVSVIVRRLGSYLVYVGGEVKAPKALRLRAGMTVFQAIEAAGGLDKTANRKKVILIRRDADGKPVAHWIDMRPMLNGEDATGDVQLAAFDIVHVPTSKIADANLVVEQYIRNMLPIQPGLGFPIP